MDPITQQAALGAAGAGGDDPLYADDVFSTYLYEGNASARSINNGLNLSGEGGLVWLKPRNQYFAHFLFDTERGVSSTLGTDSTSSAYTSSRISSFNSNGFSLTNDAYSNGNGYEHVSWSFRKAPGFFDVVTYTGNGSAGRTIAHNLGSVPGVIIIKCTDDTDDWIVYHRSLGNSNKVLLNSNAASNSTTHFHNTTPTSSVFTVGNNNSVNGNSKNYVAYIFAHDDQSFGENEDESIIACGTYSGNSPNPKEINLGWEPQWLFIKRTDGDAPWLVMDTMRGIYSGQTEAYLDFSSTNNETLTSQYNGADVTPVGFNATGSGGWWTNNPSGTYIYMAIRRPHKPPTAGTDVYKAIIGSDNTAMTTGFTVDMHWIARHSGHSNSCVWVDRFRDTRVLNPSNTDAGSAGTTAKAFQTNDGLKPRGWFSTAATTNHFFRRVPGFFDLATYTSDGSTSTFSHNLGVEPELMINKCDSATFEWWTYAKVLGINGYMRLDTNAAAGTGGSSIWGGTAPTATQMSFGSGLTSVNGRFFMVYLFASLPGISKVGQYSGTGSAVNVDCGFTAGARLVLIKRTDSTGDWYLWNHADGIVSGNDPYRLLNDNSTTQVTNTDYIDPLNAGFTVTSSAPAALNTSGGNYIFLAIA